WLWLTGDKPKVDKVLSGLGAYSADFTRHSGAVLVGDARSGEWTRFYGIPKAQDIVDRVERLLGMRGTAKLTERRQNVWRASLIAGLLVALSPLSSIAHDHNAASTSGSLPAEAESGSLREEKARSYFTDLPVIAQDGKERRFFSDILKDKVVLIYMFFSNC